MRVSILLARLVAWRGIGAIVVAGASVQPVLGADFPIGLRRIDRSAVDLSQQAAAGYSFTAADQQPTKSITIGLAHENDQDGSHSLTTPFALEYKLLPWDFLLTGDGFTRATSAGKPSSGPADVMSIAQYKIGLTGSWVLQPGLGLTLPVGGHNGSKQLSEAALLTLAVSPSTHVGLSGTGVVARTPAAPPGVSSYGSAFIAKGAYKQDDDHVALLLFKRSYKRGAGGGSVVSAEYDFPLLSWLSGSLVATQGLSRGQRNTTIELDLSF